jgi:lysophospholipase L1-like esterase
MHMMTRVVATAIALGAALLLSPGALLHRPCSALCSVLAGSPRPHAMKRFLLLGDSITQQSFDVAQGGWAAQLAHAYARRADVIVRGYSGYNTRWALEQREAVAASLRGMAPFDVAVVFLGANDNCREGWYQHVPRDEFRANVAAIADWLAADGIVAAPQNVILVTPPPYDAEKFAGVGADSVRSDAVARLYADTVLEVAAEKGLVSIDLYAAVRALGASWPDALRDGLHLGPDGNTVMFQELCRAIAGRWPELAHTSGSMFLPEHRAFIVPQQ